MAAGGPGAMAGGGGPGETSASANRPTACAAAIRVQVEHRVALPPLGGLFRCAVPATIPVRATHVADVRFQ